MFYGFDLKEYLTVLKQIRRKVKNELRRRPEDRLMISANGSRTEYFKRSFYGGKRQLRSIGADKPEIYRLAHFAYLDEYLARLDRNICLLEKMLDESYSLEYRDMLDKLPKHFELLDQDAVIYKNMAAADWLPHPSRDPGIMPRNAELWLTGCSPQEWAQRPYRENTKDLQHKTHASARGVKCRSKSEAAILGEYDDASLLYHTDEVILIDGIALAPDVIGLRSDGKFIYHEHLGLFTASYREEVRRKEALYARAGIIPGDNLIYTYDDPDGGINLKLVRAVINERYFGRV